MRYKRIRGHTRRWKVIEKWKTNSLNFNESYFKEYEREYKEILIHPWCNLNIVNSSVPQPKGKTKQKMLEGLLDIADFWKKELDKKGIDYSLRIWLYEERFVKSQIVCSVGEFINYYNNTFTKTETKNRQMINSNDKLSKRLEKFDWTLSLDEDYYDNTDLGDISEYSSIEEYNLDKIWFNKLMSKTHKVHKLKNPIGKRTETYAFKRGHVWVGVLK